MTETYLTYRRFTDMADLQPLMDFLRQQGLDCRAEDQSVGSLDPVYAGTLATKDYRLKLKPPDFERADALLMEYHDRDIDHLPPDYYLFTFSDNELLDIIAQRDEWGLLDFLLARKLLAERGIALSDEEVAKRWQQRLHQLAQPEKEAGFWLAVGYGAAFSGFLLNLWQILRRTIEPDVLVVPDWLGGVIGFFVGYWLSLRKTLPNGQRVFVFDERSRRHGKAIRWLSVIILAAWNAAKLYILYIAKA
jgi:hypothetical protein